MNTETIIYLAAQMSEAFEGSTRDNGDSFRKLRQDHPQWMTDVMHAAHMAGEFLPNDWIYSKAEDAIDHIANLDECADLDDEGHAFADGATDVYNGALAAWLALHLAFGGYVDEATEELGARDSVYLSIQQGQYLFLTRMFSQIVAALDTVAEDMPEDANA